MMVIFKEDHAGIECVLIITQLVSRSMLIQKKKEILLVVASKRSRRLQGKLFMYTSTFI